MKALLFALLVALAGCADVAGPAVSYKLTNDKLEWHSTSTFNVKRGDIVNLSLDAAYLTNLPEKSKLKSKREPSINIFDRNEIAGDREILIYATIKKDDKFLKNVTITEAKHQSEGSVVTITKPNFFADTVNDNYSIMLKAYETDATIASYILQMITGDSVNSFDSTAAGLFPAIIPFTTGVKSVLTGVSNMTLSLVGWSLDDLAKKIANDKVFEHSIYIVPSDSVQSNQKETLVLLGQEANCTEPTKEIGVFENSRGVAAKNLRASVKCVENEIVAPASALSKGKVPGLENTSYFVVSQTYDSTSRDKGFMRRFFDGHREGLTAKIGRIVHEIEIAQKYLDKENKKLSPERKTIQFWSDQKQKMTNKKNMLDQQLNQLEKKQQEIESLD